MAKEAVRASANELVALADADFRAPIAPEMAARPYSEKSKTNLDDDADDDEEVIPLRKKPEAESGDGSEKENQGAVQNDLMGEGGGLGLGGFRFRGIDGDYGPVGKEREPQNQSGSEAVPLDVVVEVIEVPRE